MEHTLGQSFEFLSSILRCRANTVEYKNLKRQLNKAELDALKQLQSKPYLATQKAKQQTATRSQNIMHHARSLTLMAPQSVGSWSDSIADVDEGRSTTSSTQYFNISQNSMPITAVGDETIPTIDLRRTENDVDKESMHGVLTHYAHAIAGAATEASNHPNDKDREFHLDLQFAKFENAMAFATNHGLTDIGTCTEGQRRGADRKRRRKKKRK